MKIERSLILNDVHMPYEDRIRYLIALKIAKALGIDRIFLNGDIGEFQGVSKWPMHPSEQLGFCKELNYLNKKFDELQEMFPSVPVTYICGNHENRFFRFIRDVAPQMWGVVDCPQLLKFDERPLWKFVDYGPEQLVKCGASNLYLRHEPFSGGKNHAQLTAESMAVDLAYGHTHTYQLGSHKKFGPKPVTTKAYSLGWLGDKSRHCFDYRSAKSPWVLGCTIVEADVETGAYTLEFINLEKLPVFFRGQKYAAK